MHRLPSLSPKVVLLLGLAGSWLAVGLLSSAAPPPQADGFDPFDDVPAVRAPSGVRQDPFRDDAPSMLRSRESTILPVPEPDAGAAERTDDRATRGLTRPAADCLPPNEKQLSMLTIDIQIPEGQLPTDHAAACWEGLNAASGPIADERYWPVQCYFWNATGMFHRPLYFEEVNLERHGYGHHDCLQPFVSAAHFFGTVPALPYCLAAYPPHDCQYTLGHYRPGSCPPWRCNWPPARPLAGLTQAGVLAGLIILFP